jgi:tetratricopeptide (TPR) repeat protein
VGDEEMAFRGRHFRLATLLELGDVEAVDMELEGCLRLARELRQPVYFWQSGCLQAMRTLLDGRLEEGERLALEAQKIGRRGHAPIAWVLFGTQLLFLRWAQRRLEEITDPIRELAERYPRSSWRPSITMVYAETGRLRDAAAELDAMGADGFRYLRRDGNWLASICVLCLAAESLRDQARCAELYELIAPYESRMVLVGAGSICLGPVTLYRGLLARVIGRLEDAQRHFEALLATSRRIGAAPFVAWAQLELAATALARGEDRPDALARLAAARADAQALGFECLVARADAARALHER